MTFIQSSGTLGSTTTEVILSNIPQTFTHLQLRCFAKSAFSGVAWLYLNINGSGSYISHSLRGDGSSTSSFSDGASALGFMSVGSTPNIFGVAIIDILDYTNTNKNKVCRSITGFDANGSGAVGIRSSLRTDSAPAVTSLFINDGGGGGWLAGSRFDLYGITVSALTGA